ncbi:phytanoyl-CoA dioxygenase [Leucothrix sargassi]|nr:phytanoyl-CoA dioxygenase [Leucothrix sargassi]
MSPAEHYDAHGYAVLRKLLSDEELSLLSGPVERIYQAWRIENEANIFDHRLVNMHSLTRPEYFKETPEQRVAFFQAITSKTLTKAIEELFGTEIHFHNTQLFFNPTNTERQPYWHRDLQYSPIEDAVQRDEQAKMLSLHVRIPLTDEQGIEVVKGTHKRWDTALERNVRLELNGHNNNESLPNSELIALACGDVLVFNAQMIHRGNYALNSERKALDLCIGRYHPLAATYLDPLVLPTTEELEQIENKHWYELARKIAHKT